MFAASDLCIEGFLVDYPASSPMITSACLEALLPGSEAILCRASLIHMKHHESISNTLIMQLYFIKACMKFLLTLHY